MKGIVLCTHPVLAAFLSLFLASYLQSSINVFVEIVEAVPVSEIEGSSFEISLTSSSYVAILFYDQSQVSEIVREQWTDAAALLNDGASGYELQGGAEVAIIDGEDPTLSEIIEMYEIAQIPTIKVFRRAILHEYRGPILRSTKPDVTIAEQIAEYLSEDCKPSVTILTDMGEIKSAMKEERGIPIVLGFFDGEEAVGDDASTLEEGYDLSTWGQFQASADALRGHAVFYVLANEEARQAFDVDERSSLPVVFLLDDDKGALVPYDGDILELNLSEWVLRNSSPRMGRLWMGSNEGEVYATQFFSARRLKFILCLRSENLVSREGAEGGGSGEEPDVLLQWGALASSLKGQAIFAYMLDTDVPDVLAFFDVSAAHLPVMVAHDPAKDARYKSTGLASGTSFTGSIDGNDLREFVHDVVAGRVDRALRSEAVPVPSPAADASVWGPSSRNGNDHGDDEDEDEDEQDDEQEHEERLSHGAGQSASKEASVPQVLVGANVVERIRSKDRDILLLLHHGKAHKFRAETELLARAVAAESRVVIAKIDLALNDVPVAWEKAAGLTTGDQDRETKLPALLWFPYKDRRNDRGKGEGKGKVPVPQKYWSASVSLPELLVFIQREGSYDPTTLRVASMEQLGMLMQDLEALTTLYNEEMRVARRNDDRLVYESGPVDYLVGEIVYDGKRWHVLAIVMALAMWSWSLIVVYQVASKRSLGGGNNKTKRA